MSDLFLTEQELVTLTGFQHCSKQVAHLKAQRIPFHTNRAGHPRVARAVVWAHSVNAERFEKAISNIRAAVKAEKAKKLQKRRDLTTRKKATAAALPEQKRYHTAMRRAKFTRQLPSWADKEAIKVLYRQAKILTQQTGIPHHVDHIIPLTGKLVSGLHVHTNLEVMPALDNLRKHNHFEVLHE